jgi:hypothetical protein
MKRRDFVSNIALSSGVILTTGVLNPVTASAPALDQHIAGWEHVGLKRARAADDGRIILSGATWQDPFRPERLVQISSYRSRHHTESGRVKRQTIFWVTLPGTPTTFQEVASYSEAYAFTTKWMTEHPVRSSLSERDFEVA